MAGWCRMSEARNKAGRPIWFVAQPMGEGTVRPVTPEGRRAFLFAVLWTLICGAAGMIGFALTWSPACFIGMFVAEAIGLALFVRTVIRHS